MDGDPPGVPRIAPLIQHRELQPAEVQPVARRPDHAADPRGIQIQLGAGGWDEVVGRRAVVGRSLYFGSGRYHYAIDTATGKVQWKYDWGADGEWERSAYQPTKKNQGTRSSPQYVNGRLYFGTASCAVYCLDAATGDVAWEVDVGGEISGAPTVMAGLVYVATLAGRTLAFDLRTGRVAWRFPDGKYTPIAADRERVYLVGHTRVYALVPRR